MDDAHEIADWLRLFIEPGQVTELRALDVSDNGKFPHTESGWFDHDHLDDMATAATRLTRYSVGVYFIPNPINPALLARGENKVKQANKDRLLTSDNDIVRRKWMLIDADPVRPDGISSTDDEKAHAHDTIMQAKEAMQEVCPDWVLADSGNGYHLLYKIDLKSDSTEMVRFTLQHLAKKLDNDRVKIDQKVFNASRIVKLYGTWSRKGDNTKHRPQRKTRVIEWSLGR